MNDGTPLVAGAGICCVDYIVMSPNVKWGDTVHMSKYIVQGGGLVGTAIVACARLGAGCDLVSLLGDDQIGDQILAELVDEGISCDHVLRMPCGESPFSFVHVEEQSGERTIFHRPGTGLDPTPDQFRFDNAGEWGALLVDDYYPDLAAAAAKAARAHGVPVVGDLTPDDRNAHLLPLIDVLIAPRHYARGIGLDDNLDAALDAIHKLGPTTAVITLGSEGWVYSDPKGRGRGKAFQVDVVDTTGAGDTFHGAFTYGLAKGWETAKCAEFASAVAAIKCTQPGGRTGLPSLEQTMEFLREREAATFV